MPPQETSKRIAARSDKQGENVLLLAQTIDKQGADAVGSSHAFTEYVVILATANINGPGLPAAVDGGACSTLKKTGSNQDPKRTDGASGRAADDDAAPVTSFQESLDSTIKDQENAPQKQHKAGTAGTKVKNSRNTAAQKIIFNIASIRYAARERATSDTAAKTDSIQGQQVNAPPTAAPDIARNPAAVGGIASLTALVNALQFSASTNNPPVTSESSSTAAATANPKPGAIAIAAAATPVKLDSTTQAPAADPETLVFDGTLHSAAPLTTQPHAELPGTARQPWLLNSQPVYAAPETTKRIDSPDQSQERNTGSTIAELPATPGKVSNSNAGAVVNSRLPLQPAGSAIATQSASETSRQLQDKTAANSAQPKPAADSAHAELTPAGPAEPARQTGADPSSSNTSGWGREAKQESAGPDKTRQTEVAADGPQMVSPPPPDGSRIEAAAQTKTAASSKPGTLPIDQQADTRQPAMKTDLNMRIQGQSGESVNLRISERAGDIQISVRSSDQGTANALKHELPSIEAGLERAGWRIENGGMSQSGQEQREAGRDAQNSDRNREQNPQSPNWQDRNQRRRDSSPDNWFEMEQ